METDQINELVSTLKGYLEKMTVSEEYMEGYDQAIEHIEGYLFDKLANL